MIEKDKIQKLRKDINNLIKDKVNPMREELEKLLDKQSELICPFCIDDIITLPNGKKGKITQIEHYHINKFDDLFIDNSFLRDKIYLDELDRFTYSVDDNEFEITWMISGLRLLKDGKVGKKTFVNISPEKYIIDKENKIITDKKLSDYMNINDLFVFDSLK